jgi:hypothetical protein
VRLILGNQSEGKPNHFYVSLDGYHERSATTTDTSESELMNALKKVVFG